MEYECYDHYPFWPHESPIIRHYPKARDLWLRSFEELLKTASDAGVKRAIENIDGLPSTEIVELINRVGLELVGVCFDSSHTTFDN
jgi:sugar phosphate isomerase/epimerase